MTTVYSSNMLLEILFRVFLAIVNIELEHAEPFNRKIHENELWLYKNPRVESYVPASTLWAVIIIVPLAVILLIMLLQKEKGDFSQAVLSFTLSLGFTGVLTNILKIIVGRPRPDYFYRCFPDGQVNFEFECTGDPSVIRDGKKSFPSGHSSLAFASFGFVALYLAGKLHTFSWNGKGQSWKLFLFVLPLGTALAIAVSRTCDYHHHWQDVMIGSALGFVLTFLCYRHYYPPLDSLVCHKPYASLMNQVEHKELKTTRIELNKWT
ncbi:phospholipid phosphatase 5 [Phymastichus coffea]|uniref:phospholipid phosphatase 5 n=1 Tax=Phymastichus coffea TaxID=108790 RepID=UPI00273C937D|nr:phospholipid phosphatase 5 [Phymastichus coffea]